MIVRLKANNVKISIPKDKWDSFTEDQKLRYEIIDKTDAKLPSTQSVVNEAKNESKKK